MRANEGLAWMWLPNRDPIPLDVAVPDELRPSFGAHPRPSRP